VCGHLPSRASLQQHKTPRSAPRLALGDTQGDGRRGRWRQHRCGRWRYRQRLVAPVAGGRGHVHQQPSERGTAGHRHREPTPASRPCSASSTAAPTISRRTHRMAPASTRPLTQLSPDDAQPATRPYRRARRRPGRATAASPLPRRPSVAGRCGVWTMGGRAPVTATARPSPAGRLPASHHEVARSPHDRTAPVAGRRASSTCCAATARPRRHQGVDRRPPRPGRGDAEALDDLARVTYRLAAWEVGSTACALLADAGLSGSVLGPSVASTPARRGADWTSQDRTA
jgi:hypothetical protein